MAASAAACVASHRHTGRPGVSANAAMHSTSQDAPGRRRVRKAAGGGGAVEARTAAPTPEPAASVADSGCNRHSPTTPSREAVAMRWSGREGGREWGGSSPLLLSVCARTRAANGRRPRDVVQAVAVPR